MAVVELQTFTDPFYSYATQLEGKSYILSFRYNQRESCWYLSIALPDGTPITSGIKVVCNVNLLWRAYHTEAPPGKMFALTASTTNTEHPGLNDFGPGKRVSLVYVTSDDD